MHVFERIAMRVVAELLKLAAFAHLPLRTDSKSILAKKNHGDTFPLLKKIWIYTDFNSRRLRMAHIPQAEARLRLEVHRWNTKTATFTRRARPSQHRLLGCGGQLDPHILAVGAEAGRKVQAKAN